MPLFSATGKFAPQKIDDSRQPLVSQSPPTRSRNGPVSYVSSGSSQQSSARAANRPYPYPLDANRSSSKSSRRFGKGSETPMDDRSSATITKAWDVFRLLPPPPDNFGKGFWNDVSLQILKISCFIILFLLTLTSAAVAKSLFLLMTSAIGWGGQTMVICNNKIPEGLTNYVIIEKRHTVKWIWAALLSLAAPELFCFCRSFHRSLFRNVKAPTFLQFLVVFIIESLHAVGVGMLVFHILPDLTATTGATLSSAMCLVPCVLTLLSRKPNKKAIVLIFFDVLCIIAQTSSYWVLPALSTANNQFSWLLPISLTLISLAWWQNFVHTNSALPPIQAVAKFANTLSERRSKTYVFVSLWKCAIYAICAFLFTSYRMPINNLFQSNPFGSKVITVSSLNMNQSQIAAFEDRMKQYETAEPSNFYLDNVEYLLNRLKGEDSDMHLTTENPLHNREGFARPSKRSAEWVDQPETADPYRIYEDKVELNQFTSPYDAFWVVVIQVFAVALCYHSSKFACKVMMQRSGFAFPIILSSPLTVAVLSSVCAQRSIHPCQLYSLLTKELFWRCDANLQSWSAFVKSPQTWMWACWLLSQFWVTIHLWRPKHERLAKTEKLFILSTYNGAFIDISLALNRRRDDKTKILEEDLELDSEDVSSYEMMSGRVHKSPPSLCSTVSSKVDTGLIRETASSADAITKIYACATMWHESALEMTCMLKSLFRMDEDQCARRNAQKYLKVVDPDYYEFEAHIFFDDAFEMNDYGEPVINQFVRQLVEKVDEAASAVHRTQMRLRTPKTIATPYGGRICYLLPGKNRMTVHLKDKNKIRHRKRWSQVMYLYYLLGYRLMMKIDDEARKELISEHTFILTLDGDVDFTPQCVHLLVDLMKKNRKLGAACGRIHPRGSGAMVWYQKFEYAIGHWLQKATEHMIGCVLCSPGCFSLFRSYALMDDNVARRYASRSEKPLDYIQYDQGEDRWLCTLLLQRGYRVEYCAASDALTFAPEGFNEFFNQRRRWIPSTLANIIDLIKDYKHVVAVNECISIWYIIYQTVMLISSILGPGTIFLMVVGAISISFNISTMWALLITTLPVSVFIFVCLMGKPQQQLVVAQIVGALFAMLMTAVIVGTSLQIQKDGILSPHSIFLFAVIASFLTAAILHPLEFTCIIPGILYFLAIPCMYMLLPIYSICNLNTVAWGTRETPKEAEEQQLSTTQKGIHIDILSDNMGGRDDGEVSLGCGNVCKLMCCLGPNKIDASPQIWQINKKLDEMSAAIEKLNNRMKTSTAQSASVGARSVEEKPAQHWLDDDDDQDDMDDNRDMSQQSAAAMRNRKWTPQVNDAWMSDRLLKRAEKEVLDSEEETFWMEMIDKYLTPIAVNEREQDRIRVGLTELRNKACFAFFMINTVFIIIVLVLQMQKDCLHIEWPLGPKFNHTIVPCHSDIQKEVWVMTRLQLEPIGLVFLAFFMSILIIQFVAMLMHRFGTLAHIIASTELICCRKPHDRLSEDELVIQNAVEIARELQAIRGVDESFDAASDSSQQLAISRRRVVQNLESSKKMVKRTETLDAAFKKRFFALSSEEAEQQRNVSRPHGGRERRLTLRKGTIRAIEQRRNSLYGTIDRNRCPPTDDGKTKPNMVASRKPIESVFDGRSDSTAVGRNAPSNHSSFSDEQEDSFGGEGHYGIPRRL